MLEMLFNSVNMVSNQISGWILIAKVWTTNFSQF